ncbi:LysM domain-containing protein, partial [Streptomyces sp. TRM76130]|nr:LysM domain-containing protein [Streptomyces sp. TRM76130]
ATDEAAAERDGTGATDATGSADDLVPSPGASSLTKTGDGGTAAGTGTGRHRAGDADEEAAEGRSESSSGRHASRDDETARDAGDGTYTVRAGDSLWAIADSLGLAGGWSSL